MRIVRTLLAAALAGGAPAAAQAPEAPCAAVKTTALPPCDAPAAKPAPVLATVDGAPLGEADLDPEFRKRIGSVDETVAAARRAALEAEIADTRLHLEAERRGLSFRDFWEAEVLKKTPPAPESDLRAEFERARKRFPGKSFEDVKPRLESFVLALNRVKREVEVAASLKDRYPAVAGADPSVPGQPRDAVLATVGGRPITAESAAARLDAAEFSARRELYYQTLNALEKAAGARALKEEADRRGTTPEELLKADREAVSKLMAGKRVAYSAEPPRPPVLAMDAAGAPTRGPAAARVTVIEYADFECPHCSSAWEAAEEALKPYGNRVRYAYRSFPLPFHEHALKSAEAARAAQAQGRFFEMASLLFRNQQALDDASLKKYAGEAGCDAARFAADLDSGRYKADVLLEAREGERLGVAGTPNFFVNGVWLRWEEMDVKGIRAAVDAALARPGAPPAGKAAP